MQITIHSLNDKVFHINGKGRAKISLGAPYYHHLAYITTQKRGLDEKFEGAPNYRIIILYDTYTCRRGKATLLYNGCWQLPKPLVI